MKEIINIVCMGCSKNLVDAEHLAKQLDSNKFEVHFDYNKDDASIVIINTCGFIGDAKEESIEVILNFAEARKNGSIKKLFVMGCLSERYREELKVEMPEVDKFYGKFDWKEIIREIKDGALEPIENDRIISTPSHFAYLKISEGCNKRCSYCAIPLITGEHKSIPMEDLVEEAQNLQKKGVKELLVIAQDLSYYGVDLYGEYKLAELLNRLSQIEGIEWIRIHYAYPSDFPMNVIEEMAKNPKICHYLDIALQHSSDKMLKIMRRGINREKTLELISNIRNLVPDICLRTTFLVGHPGETEEDFDDLVEFAKEIQFDRVGVFPYSFEENTHTAENYVDDIPQEVKDERVEVLMNVQENILFEKNEKLVGKKFKVIVDSEDSEYYIARSQYDSPEVDLEIFIDKSEKLNIGDFYIVNINKVETFNLYASLDSIV
ncbi:30S ribosomal protein S12 methylthiotransferase RimO [Marinilabiliaceae bacterium JC040]|nr:30S ribosomal protein S12 methylthiotransferase RimO [Marinilabiliaceae bacterium JC040]